MANDEEEKTHTEEHQTPVEDASKSAEKPAKEEVAEEKTEDKPAEPAALADKKKFSLKDLLASKKGKLSLAVAAGVILVIGLLFVIPTTRYGILGTFVKRDVTLTLMDSSAKRVVTDADVQLAGATGKSDSEGKVKLSGVPVGPQELKVTKKFYKDYSGTINVWIASPAEPAEISLEATGRQVPVQVTNKVSGKPLQGATLSVNDATTITDDKGQAVLVVAADAKTVDATIKLDGYNEQKVTVTVLETYDEKNGFTLTPYGKVYFLSKRTGKIDVMKSDLDGSNAQVVLTGTGKEQQGSTSLLASRDWKYLALLARRDSEVAKVYLIDTTKGDALSVMDEGKASFTLTGWAGHRFVYKVNRTGIGDVGDGKYSIKSFDAESRKLTTLDTTKLVKGEGVNSYQQTAELYASGPYLLGDEILYSKNWTYPQYSIKSSMKIGVYSIKADGTGKKTVIDNPNVNGGYYIYPYGVNEAYVLVDGDTKQGYEYEHGKLTSKALTDEEVYGAQSTYLLSPSGNATLWTEPRDGKNTVLIGDKDGSQVKSAADLSEYKQYGWYTDDYILLSKSNSELYIMARTDGSKPFKVTDYHKADYGYNYYGGGYGGF